MSARDKLKRGLNGRHNKIILLSAAGLSNIAIAESMGISRITVSSVLNSDLGKIAVERAKQGISEETLASTAEDLIKVRRKLNKASDQAAEELQKLLMSEDERIRLRACNAILDKTIASKQELTAPVSVQVTEEAAAVLESLGASDEEPEQDFKSTLPISHDITPISHIGDTAEEEDT